MGWLIFLIAWWIFYLYQLVNSLFSANAGAFALWLVLGGIASWIIGLLCTAGMEGSDKPKYEEAIDPVTRKVHDNNQLTKADLDQILKEYNKEVNKIIGDPNKSDFDLKWFTSKFQESLNLWRKIYNLMYELSWTYAYYSEKTNVNYRVWHSKVIPISSIKTKIAKWSKDSDKAIRIKHQDIQIFLGEVNNDFEKTRRMEVLQNDKVMFQVDIKTKARDYGDSYGTHEEPNLVEIFKPNDWIMLVLNLITEYEVEKKAIAQEASQTEKESLKSNYLA